MKRLITIFILLFTVNCFSPIALNSQNNSNTTAYPDSVNSKIREEQQRIEEINRLEQISQEHAMHAQSKRRFLMILLVVGAIGLLVGLILLIVRLSR